MKVDVSEIKVFKTCSRQWMFSSRNRMHLRPRVAAPQLALGTLFHEALAQLYLGSPIEKVMAMLRKEMDPDNDVALLAMVPGYAKHVLPGDRDHLRLLDIEHHFEFKPVGRDGEVLNDDLVIVGSIDRIMIDDELNTIYGFEDKTCKDFRSDAFLWMDEQPRVYVYALYQYVEQYNAKQLARWSQRMSSGEEPIPEKPIPVRLGGIYMNEVKKLLRDFKHKRTLCVYSAEDLAGFMESFFATCESCYHAAQDKSAGTPSPGYFACSMCDFKEICTTYMYTTPSEEAVLKDFDGEFHVKTEDHLEEKSERSATE